MVANHSAPHHRVTQKSKLPHVRYHANPQPVDYKQVFSDSLELCNVFTAPTDLDLTNISASIRKIQIQNFYGCVRREVGGTTPYSVQRIFETFYKNAAGEINQSNKWRGYLRGGPMPGLNTLTKVKEITGVDFNPELHQVLWIAMDVTVPLENRTKALLKTLDEEVRDLALLIYAKLHRKNERIDYDSFGWCHSLSEKAGLQALAAMTLLFREANELGIKNAKWQWPWFLFHMLLVLGPELQQRGIAYLVYPFYLKHIFPLNSEYELEESPQGMAHMSMVLNLLAFTQGCSRGERLPFEKRVYQMCQCLISQCGSVLGYAFEPKFRPRTFTTESDQDSEDNYFNTMKSRRDLSWRTLTGIIRTGRVPMIFHVDTLDVDLDCSMLAEDGRDYLLDIAGQMLAN
jgi:hypothetical protein